MSTMHADTAEQRTLVAKSREVLADELSRRTARRAAVADALERAQAFAAALGLGNLAPVALADPGMLGDQAGSAADRMIEVASLRTMKDAGGELAFTPRDIELRAAVDARFVARA